MTDGATDKEVAKITHQWFEMSFIYAHIMTTPEKARPNRIINEVLAIERSVYRENHLMIRGTLPNHNF